MNWPHDTPGHSGSLSSSVSTRATAASSSCGPSPAWYGRPFLFVRRQLGEPALNEIQPGAIGRREMEREARVAHEPALDRRRLVGRGVVEHNMHVEMSRHRGLDQVEETAELLRPMPWRHLGEHLAGGDVERGVEIGGAVADVVVALPF